MSDPSGNGTPVGTADRPAPSRRAGSGGWRARVRRTPGGAVLLKVGTFLLGAVFIGLGLAAAVLPGPLTIPPVLLGLWIWAGEFVWAQALLERAQEQGRAAWEAAKRNQVVATVTTVAGLVAAGAVVWVVDHFSLVARAGDAVGL